MPINKLALIRYKTIDSCLQNHYRKWTLQDLVDACSEAVMEYEGIGKGVSLRTIQLDIQNMRSEKLGYNAPIVVTDKKYYSYEEKGFTITNIPLTDQELGTLKEVVTVLKQFSGLNYFNDVNGMITRLEDKLQKRQNNGRSFIDFEKNELLKGLEHIAPLHKAIAAGTVLDIRYKSFKRREEQTIIFYPHLLKEYRNRWFLLGVNRKGKGVVILALDRIEQFFLMPDEPFVEPHFEPENFFSDVIGVSKMLNQKPNTIVLWVDKDHAPYILTKPLHQSQTVLRRGDKGLIFSIQVVWNFELEREILGFGEYMRVLAPKRLAGKLIGRLKRAAEVYRNQASEDLRYLISEEEAP